MMPAARIPAFSYEHRLPRPVWLAFRALRAVLVASAFVWFWGGAFLLAWTVLPVLALVAREPRRACQRVVSAAFRVFHGYMRVLALVDARFVSELPRTSGPVVFVANHATLVDMTAILSHVPDVCCVAKSVYASSRLVGRLLALSGFIDAGTSLGEQATSMDVAAKRLADGSHVLVFPEGSRSPEGGMTAFRRGAFEIACRAKVPVVPLYVRCNPSALRKDQRFWHHPDTVAHLTIEVGEPIDPAAFEFRSRRMRDAVEAQFREHIASARDVSLLTTQGAAGSERGTG